MLVLQTQYNLLFLSFSLFFTKLSGQFYHVTVRDLHMPGATLLIEMCCLATLVTSSSANVDVQPVALWR